MVCPGNCKRIRKALFLVESKYFLGGATPLKMFPCKSLSVGSKYTPAFRIIVKDSKFFDKFLHPVGLCNQSVNAVD